MLRIKVDKRVKWKGIERNKDQKLFKQNKGVVKKIKMAGYPNFEECLINYLNIAVILMVLVKTMC